MPLMKTISRTLPLTKNVDASKSELEKISKFLIEKVNTIIRDKSIVNKWRDMDTMICWFENIDNKSNCVLMQLPLHLKSYFRESNK